MRTVLWSAAATYTLLTERMVGNKRARVLRRRFTERKEQNFSEEKEDFRCLERFSVSVSKQHRNV